MSKTMKDVNLNNFYALHKQECDSNYYLQELLPLMRNGDWKKVQQQQVFFFPNGNKVQFLDDEWDLSPFSPQENAKILFTYHGKKLLYTLVNELKSYVLARVYTGHKQIKIGSLRTLVDDLKRVVTCMTNAGIASFSQLTDEKYKEIAQINNDIFTSDRVLASINPMVEYYDVLPFSIHFTKQTRKKTGVQPASQKQHLTIPPRIYTTLLTQYSTDVNAVIPHLPQVEAEINRMLNVKADFKMYVLERFRRGLIKPPFSENKTMDIVRERFKQESIDLIDNLEGEHNSPGRWMEIINEISPGLINIAPYTKSKKWSYDVFKIGEQRFETIGEFQDWLMEFDMKGKALCLLLSGMRVDELNSMHPAYGAQSYKYNGQTIHIFTTRQSKITKGIQTEEDFFVTNQTGHNAFKLLTTIPRPYLNRISDNEQTSYFASIKQSYYLRKIVKANWSNTLSQGINKWIDLNVGSLISAEDESFLRISNPSNTGIEAGSTFKFTNHQTRRSFAFYMVGLELMAYPQLKKQLSHLSSAMTRHYANNASYWGLLRNEIHQERILQKSTILANVYKRLAQGGIIAGGKGKTLKKLAGSKNYFESGEGDRRLAPDYWAKLIKNGKEHVHAIAPGMYCTNAQCDMRINVALDECVECEFDFIMDGLYAEGKRLAAHRNLAVLGEMNDLNHNVASQLVVVIKSCEKILSDLEIPFKPIEIPENIKEMLIETVAE
ncbi:MAG: hypothetical protein CML20_18480 [Rheinheimera sp.]|nr:hypothetical protein [Rheinheimera sp.]